MPDISSVTKPNQPKRVWLSNKPQGYISDFAITVFVNTQNTLCYLNDYSSGMFLLNGSDVEPLKVAFLRVPLRVLGGML